MSGTAVIRKIWCLMTPAASEVSDVEQSLVDDCSSPGRKSQAEQTRLETNFPDSLVSNVGGGVMTVCKSKFFSTGFAVIACGLAFPCVAQVVLHFNERPPYAFFSDGRLAGLIGAPVIAAFDEAGIVYSVSVTPFARQVAIIKSNTGLDCALNWLKNEEREGFGKFSASIYKDKKRVALANARNGKVRDGDSIEAVLSNKNIALLVKKAYSYGKPLDTAILRLDPTRTEVSVESPQMVQMIMAGRADLMFISQEEAEGVLAASGLGASDIRIVTFSDAPEGESRYMVCSKKVPDEIINKFNNAIRRLKSKGARN